MLNSNILISFSSSLWIKFFVLLQWRRRTVRDLKHENQLLISYSDTDLQYKSLFTGLLYDLDPWSFETWLLRPPLDLQTSKIKLWIYAQAFENNGFLDNLLTCKIFHRIYTGTGDHPHGSQHVLSYVFCVLCCKDSSLMEPSCRGWKTFPPVCQSKLFIELFKILYFCSRNRRSS